MGWRRSLRESMKPLEPTSAEHRGPGPDRASRNVDREMHESVLRWAGRMPTAPGAPWLACRAVAHVLVVDGDAGHRACEHAARGLDGAIAGGDPWHAPDLEQLRAALAAGQLPIDHCRGCARWLDAGLPEHAPPVRQHGDLPAVACGRLPTSVVLRLPAGGDFDAAVAASLPHLLQDCDHVTVVASTPLATGSAWLAALRNAPRTPAIRLAWHGEQPPELAPLQGLRLAVVEWTTPTDRRDALQVLRRACDGAGAKGHIRFVLTPTGWFDFEDAVLAASAAGLTAEWAVLDHDAQVPLDALDVDELTLVKNFVASAWSRLAGERHPSAIDANAIHGLVEQLRRLLLQRLQSASPPTPGARLAMPPPRHSWFVDSSRSAWAWEQMLMNAHHAGVGRHLVELARQGGLAVEAARSPGLRALMQRLAHERRTPELLSVLRDLYRSSSDRAALVAADAQFAAAHDLGRFGGPWAGGLGLGATTARVRPFTIGKTRKAGAEVAPDVTVLVPSYNHGAYIQECLQSVLAQRHTSFRLLVVDDCSPDDTVEKARARSDRRIEVRVNGENLGLGNSVLAALATIDTPYVALLNSDDLYHPDRLGRCCKVLDGQPEVNLVTTGMRLVDADGGEIDAGNASLALDGQQLFDWVHWFAKAKPRGELSQDELLPALLERNFLVTSSNIVCRTDWLRARAESLRSLKYCLDWQLFLDAARERSLRHIDEPLLAYRLHASNTVWFRGGRRWAFYLEVNRVVAGALRGRIADIPAASDRLLELLRLLAGPVLRNRECDGAAMFVNAVCDAVQADAIAAQLPAVQAEVARLNEAALATLALRDAASVASSADGENVARSLAEVASELLTLERDRADRNQRYADSLDARIRECWDGRGALEGEKLALVRRQGELAEELRVAQQDAQTLRADQGELARRLQASEEAEGLARRRAEGLLRDLDAVRGDLQIQREQAAVVAEVRELVHRELAGLRAERDRLAGELQEKVRAAEGLGRALAQTGLERDGLRGERDRLAASLDERSRAAEGLGLSLAQAERSNAALQVELAATQDEAAKRAEALRAALDQASGLAQDRQQSLEQMERRQADLEVSLQAASQRLADLRRSRELAIGDLIWNKTPLSFMSRHGKKFYNRIFDAGERLSLWFGGRFGRRTAEGVAVVASCWHWPIYSHTFVYQEMIGLTHMGLDVRMFHWEENDASQLQPAFSYLADHRTLIKPIWENHVKDKAHFDKTKPGRLRALLERIAAITGKSVDDLEKEHYVLQACTFARMAEYAGARYIHTYFFYDQSFMGLVASWLLEIPRGISCYADHMLDDFPFKLVALQIELASVVVATSERIKKELSQLSGGRFDDRIIVKPNGVDGERFPLTPRPPRQPKDLFEVVSVSRIEPKKGLIHLAEAIAMLKRRGHAVRAHVIGAHDPHSKGSLEYSQQLEARIAELDLRDDVLLHGMKIQEEIRPILQRSRAFVAPYVELATGDKDGIPTAMLEAMAAALPVVTTDSGSILEVVDDGVEALVVPQRDSAAFAVALEKLILDPGLEKRISQAARARFDRQFDIKVTERPLHARIAELLAEGRRGKSRAKPVDSAE